MLKQENHIDKFELCVFHNQYDQAIEVLLHLLNHLQSPVNKNYKDNYFDEKNIARSNATRLTCALMWMFKNKRFKVSYDIFCNFMIMKRVLLSIFRISIFLDSGYPYKYFSENTKKTQLKKEKESQGYKKNILISLSDLNQNELTRLKISKNRDILAILIISFLSNKIVMNECDHVGREKLFDLGYLIAKTNIDFKLLTLMSIAWMHCTYAEREDKHQIKKYLNTALQKTISNGNIPIPTVKQIDHKCTGKPRLVVIAEKFYAGHAMYRCYAEYIRQLNKEYKTILITTNDNICDEVISLFSDVESFSHTNASLKQIIELITKHRPDIVYYPSLGLTDWTIALLPFRFAPIQVLTCGHPATSMASTIDYLVMVEYFMNYEHLYSERLLLMHDGIGYMEQPKDNLKKIKKIIQKNPDKIKIAVSSSSMKISNSFLKACKYVNNNIKRNIEWHFFPNEVGLFYQHCILEIQAYLPNSVIYPRSSYEEYINRLSKCDIAAGTFPFGGSNSNIDLLLLNIPKVYMVGKEIHARTDGVIFREFDLPNWLASVTVEDWSNALIRLIGNDEERVKISQSLQEQSSDEFFINNSRKKEKTGFLDAVNWVWNNHEQIIANNEKIIRPVAK